MAKNPKNNRKEKRLFAYQKKSRLCASKKQRKKYAFFRQVQSLHRFYKNRLFDFTPPVYDETVGG
ncbi:MAG: hypothetical protein MR290_03500, partial [Ruminococcus sp.]|nr:hypothetical protein [Ruminococcus sp.]